VNYLHCFGLSLHNVKDACNRTCRDDALNLEGIFFSNKFAQCVRSSRQMYHLVLEQKFKSFRLPLFWLDMSVPVVNIHKSVRT